MMFAALSLIIIGASAAEDVKGFDFSGNLDLYYQYDFGKPKTGPNVNLRQFDVNHNSFGFAVLRGNVVKKPTAENPFGFTGTFSVGKNSDIMNGAEPAGPQTYKNVEQAYVTYASPKSPVTIDFGKFYSWIGYEVTPAGDKDNYSRSFNFALNQPLYHMGFRAGYVASPTLSLTGYLVNGWNEVDDSNGGKTFGATASLTLGTKTAVILNYLGGNEGSSTGTNGFANTFETNVQLGDIIITHQLTPKLKLALNGDYGDAKTSVAEDETSFKFRGIAAYAKYQASDSVGLALRWETVSDPSGLRSGTGLDSHFNSVTGTVDFTCSKDSLLRVELRLDRANEDVFNSDSGLKGKRTTLTVAHILKF